MSRSRSLPRLLRSTRTRIDWESLRAGTLKPPLPPPGSIGLDESETAEVELEYVDNPGQWDYDW